jgi:imidazolonepropionase-like amidohydrolase
MTIVIEDGRITALGPFGSVRRPAGADVRDLSGHFVIPGLIDVHAHARAQWVMESLLAYGVTTIRNPSSSRSGTTDYAAEVNTGRMAGPRVFTAGPIIDSPPRRTGSGPLVTTPEGIRLAVRDQAAHGVDWIKLYVNLRPPLIEAAVDEAHRLGLRVGGDLVSTSWVEAAQLGVDVLSHLAARDPRLLPARHRTAYRELVGAPATNRVWHIVQWLEWIEPDGVEVSEAVRSMAATAVSMDPTLSVMEAILTHGDSTFRATVDVSRVPQDVVSSWSSTLNVPFPPDYRERYPRIRTNMLQLARVLYSSGIPLLAGTDTPMAWVPPGASLHRELELFVEAGIPPLAAIQIATLNGARALGEEHARGSVQVGREADIVVLRANPIENISHTRLIRCVVKRGLEVGVAGLSPC